LLRENINHVDLTKSMTQVFNDKLLHNNEGLGQVITIKIFASA